MEATLFVGRLLLLLVFAVAGVAKLVDRKGSRQALLDFGVPSALATPLGYLLPLVELAVAVLLIPTATAWWGAVGAVGLLLLFMAGIAYNLAHGRTPDCHCFGQLQAAPVGWSTLVRNGILTAVGGFIIWQGRENVGLSPVAVWQSLALSRTTLFLTLFALGVGLMLAGMGFVIYQLMKQQGRLLLRLDEVEARVDQGRARPAPAQPQGLAVGAPLPAFQLPDLSGKLVSLADFRGKWVLLVHWNPGCGFCHRIAADLAQLQATLAKRNAQLVLMSHGEVEVNGKLAEEHGLHCPILLLNDAASFEPFRNQGTPVAYLVDPTGKVAQPLVIGADQVPALAKQTASGRAQIKPAQLNRKRSANKGDKRQAGLSVGTPAPSFQLPDIYGRPVALDTHRGRQVLLVFSNPDCRACDEVAPHLVELHRQHRHNGLDIIMVGRGEPAANRRKAEAQGIEFPIALQQQGEVAQTYGATLTPVAFLINEEGKIAQTAAQGADAIVALVQQAFVNSEEADYERAI